MKSHTFIFVLCNVVLGDSHIFILNWFENYRISKLRTESDTSINFARYCLMKSVVKKTLESIATNQLPRHNLDFQLRIQWLFVNRIGVLLNSHLSGNSKFVFSSYQSRWEIRLTSAGIPNSWPCANIMSCSCMNMKTLTCASSVRSATTALVFLSFGILSE